MRYQTNTPISLGSRPCFYIISSHHRRPNKTNPHKSVWTISLSEEVDCFKQTFDEAWYIENDGWGLVIVNQKPAILGKNANGDTSKIARFIDSSKDTQWHGYPANYLEKTRDIPPTQILKIWKDKKLIDKSDFSKIIRQMPCNL